jgi:hypothetical protein
VAFPLLLGICRRRGRRRRDGDPEAPQSLLDALGHDAAHVFAARNLGY